MPVILKRENEAMWLDPDYPGSLQDLKTTRAFNICSVAFHLRGHRKLNLTFPFGPDQGDPVGKLQDSKCYFAVGPKSAQHFRNPLYLCV